MEKKQVKKLTMFGFFSMTASMVMAMYEYPSFATSQFAVVFFVLLGGIFWFLPTALISAEMASVEGWSEGGVFGWVGNALHSDKVGFMALFFQWFQITVGLVTMSYFVIGMLADILNWQALNNLPWLKFLACLSSSTSCSWEAQSTRPSLQSGAFCLEFC